MEEWKTIADFPEYQVSNLGRIKRGEKIKAFGYCGGLTKYHKVSLYNDKRCSTKMVHRLVAEAFIENPDDKPQIDHINQDSFDNRVENLRWVSGSENCLNKKPWFVGSNTGEPYISLYNNNYQVAKTINKKKVRKFFKSLEEAIEYRDSILNQISSPASL
jgi:hypothetical protein